MSLEVWMSAYSASGGIPSGPAALPDLRDLMALVISFLVTGPVLMSNSLLGGEISGGKDGVCLLSVSPILLSVPLTLRWYCHSGLTVFPRESPCGFIQPFHVSLAHCSLCFMGQVLNEVSLVFSQTYLHFRIFLPVACLQFLLLFLVLGLVDLVFLFFSLGDQCPCFCCQPLLVFLCLPLYDCLTCCFSGVVQDMPLFFYCFFWQLGKQAELVPQFQLEFFCFPPSLSLSGYSC
ncbi:unnamed protein product [Acanthosepion pharaonis]|uniref:Uncharacterized protein n=1 Tax=Acanthosepion pharaonis TaxID=158019 RepID=A0A812DUH3_ACAPH|nr:unnamed protein product [Sepia pharaonis]